MTLSGAGEDSWESLGLQGDQTSQSWRKSNLNIHWKHWCWGWCSWYEKPSLAAWCAKPTHWKRPWSWEGVKAKGEGVAEDEMIRQHHQLNGHEFEQTLEDSKGQKSLVCYSSWGSQRVGHDLVTEKQQPWRELRNMSGTLHVVGQRTHTGSDDQQDLCLGSVGLWQEKGQFVAGCPQDSAQRRQTHTNFLAKEVYLNTSRASA